MSKRPMTYFDHINCMLIISMSFSCNWRDSGSTQVLCPSSTGLSSTRLNFELLIALNLLKSCPMGNPQTLVSQSDQAEQVGSSKEKKAKNKKNKKHRGGGSETPAYEEGGRAGEQIRI